MEIQQGVGESSGGTAIGGDVTGGTPGSVLFVGAGSVLAQDNANFFWDDTNNRLGIGSSTPSAHLGITQGVSDGDTGLLIGSPAADGFSTRYGIRIAPTGGANTAYYGLYIDDLFAQASVPYAIYVAGGKTFLNGTLDLNGNSILNLGNTSVKADPSSSYGNLELWDYGGDYTQNRGGILSFKGTTGSPSTADATFAAIRGIKENATYVDSLGALVFYTQGDPTFNTDLTTVTEQMRISSAGLVGIGTTTPTTRLDVAGDVRTQQVVVSSLASAATAGAGARSFVTDALTPAFGVAVTGGGAVAVPVYSDGSIWLVG